MTKSRNGMQRGLSLVELLVSLAVGLLLMLAVGQIYLSARQTSRVQDAQSRLQENGRMAMDILVHDIRLAGHQGCASNRAVSPDVAALAMPVGLPNVPIEGYDAQGSAWNAPLPAELVSLPNPPVLHSQPLEGTDIVSLRFGLSCGAFLNAAMANWNDVININANNRCNIQPSTPLLVTDCHSAVILRASSSTTAGSTQSIGHDTSQNTDPPPPFPLSRAYRPGSELLLFQQNSYFVAKKQPDPLHPVREELIVPSLWRLDSTQPLDPNNNPAELVEGVENLQVLYGEDTDSDGTPNRYLPIDQIIAPENIKSVKISLLISTLNDDSKTDLTTVKQIYNYNGSANITGTYGRIRRVFNATIGLRNQLQ